MLLLLVKICKTLCILNILGSARFGFFYLLFMFGSVRFGLLSNQRFKIGSVRFGLFRLGLDRKIGSVRSDRMALLNTHTHPLFSKIWAKVSRR